MLKRWILLPLGLALAFAALPVVAALSFQGFGGSTSGEDDVFTSPVTTSTAQEGAANEPRAAVPLAKTAEDPDCPFDGEVSTDGEVSSVS